MAKKTKTAKKAFDIEVIRIGYSSQTITVEATSLKEARKLALEEAPSRSFSEHESEYKIDK